MARWTATQLQLKEGVQTRDVEAGRSVLWRDRLLSIRHVNHGEALASGTQANLPAARICACRMSCWAGAVHPWRGTEASDPAGPT